MPSFGERFKELRKELDFTQQELADKMNAKYNLIFGKSAISQYENDKRTPEITALEKFAGFFNVSIDYLLGKSNIKNPDEIIYNNAFHSFSKNGLSKNDVDMIQTMIERLKKNNEN